MYTRHSRAKITESLVSTTALCLCSLVQAQTAAPPQTFLVHGTARTCSAITQLDSALATDSQQFFEGWNEKDYADAVAWSQACANYGWHIPGRPRIPLLQTQHDRALGPAPDPNPPVQAAVAPAAPAVPSTAAGSQQPPPVQAVVAAPAQEGASVASGVALAAPTTQIAALGAAGAAAIAAPSAATTVVPTAGPGAPTAAVATLAPGAPTAVVPTVAPSRTDTAPETLGDGLLTDESFDKHFHQEAVWVAQRAHLDIGVDSGPSAWPIGGTPTQITNRLTADKIVLFCSRKSNSGEIDNRPLLWDWRRCESEEASAYNRLVAGNEFPSAGRGIVLGCAGVDSYIYLERCVESMAEETRP
jgi:hypothetical protein